MKFLNYHYIKHYEIDFQVDREEEYNLVTKKTLLTYNLIT